MRRWEGPGSSHQSALLSAASVFSSFLGSVEISHFPPWSGGKKKSLQACGSLCCRDLNCQHGGQRVWGARAEHQRGWASHHDSPIPPPGRGGWLLLLGWRGVCSGCGRYWGTALRASASLGHEAILPNGMLPLSSVTGFLLNEVGHCPAPTPPKLGHYSNHGSFSHLTHSAAAVGLEGLSLLDARRAVGGWSERGGCSLWFLFLSLSVDVVVVVVVGAGFQRRHRQLSAGGRAVAWS